MANSLNTIPKRIDTFGSGDVTIGTGVVSINAMYITAYSSAKTVTFIDNDGAKCLVIEVPSGETFPVEPSRPIRFTNGLIFDDSASDLAASDLIFIF